MNGINLGFKNLKAQNTEEPATVAVLSGEELVGLTLALHEELVEYDAAVGSMECILGAYDNLNSLRAVIDTHGCSESMIEMVRTDLAELIAIPSFEGLDMAKFSQECLDAIDGSNEGVLENVKKAIETMIKKIIDFVKSFFDKGTKIAAKITAVNKEVEGIEVDPEKLAAIELNGYKKADFDAIVAAIPALSDVVMDVLGKLEKAEGDIDLQAIADGAKGKMGKTIVFAEGKFAFVEMAKEKKPLKDLGFAAADITKGAPVVVGLLADQKALSSVSKQATDDMKKALQSTEDKDAQKKAMIISKVAIGAVGQISGKTLALAGQSLAMLSACKSAKKEAAAE